MAYRDFELVEKLAAMQAQDIGSLIDACRAELQRRRDELDETISTRFVQPVSKRKGRETELHVPTIELGPITSRVNGA